jgi:hypothetical protein
MFERRIRFASAIYKGGGSEKLSTEKIMDRIGASNSTRKLVDSVAIANGYNEEKRFVALMCSPELMGLESA